MKPKIGIYYLIYIDPHLLEPISGDLLSNLYRSPLIGTQKWELII